MRIASLVPSATETLFALGLRDQVVGVTHECDYPAETASKRRLTRSLVPDGLTAGEIDAAVRSLTGQGRHLYELDEDVLAELDVDLIATQALCEVCAVSYDDVRAVARRLPRKPEVISLDPETLAEVLDDVEALGAAAGATERARELRAELEGRLAAVKTAVTGAPRPRVVALEWLEPPFIGGHWVPEMVEIAGGIDPLGTSGARSRSASWEEIESASPDVVVAMPCGWDAARAMGEVDQNRDRIAALGAERVWAVNAAASFSRPGPRLVEGTELLAHLLHPDRMGAPTGVEFVEAEVPTPAGTSTASARS